MPPMYGSFFFGQTGEMMYTARQKKTEGVREILWDPGQANPKQREFFLSRALFTAYGGAKGGGKTWAVRTKAIGGALLNPGIRILIMRCHYPELEENHVRPILKAVPPELASYNGTSHLMSFENGSIIKFGHWAGDESENEYNGLEYDWIFIDEATQFSERAFNFLGGCLRGVNDFPKRMYLTCNPGGVGHNWVKRLFIDRDYRTYPDEPERDEHPEDYRFIFATVEDNTHLLESSPTYLKNLANMPEDLRRAYRYGDWSVLGGNYFREFRQEKHCMKPFRPPEHWERYRSFDYGLDMFACFWWAVDEDGRCWCIRELEKSGLIVGEAARALLEHTLPGERITATYAPPDMWSRQKDSGRTMAELFLLNGVPLVKSSSSRVQGHMMVKDMLSPIPLTDPFVKGLFPRGKAPERLPGLMFFNNLSRVMADLRDIQADETNPNDCARKPHEITHTVDGIRYFCVSRVLAAQAVTDKGAPDGDEDEDEESYDSFMTGGEITGEYLV